MRHQLACDHHFETFRYCEIGSDSHSVGWLRPDGSERRPMERIGFVIGIALWFTVGVMWKDRAIMVVHAGAFIAIMSGYLNS